MSIRKKRDSGDSEASPLRPKTVAWETASGLGERREGLWQRGCGGSGERRDDGSEARGRRGEEPGEGLQKRGESTESCLVSTNAFSGGVKVGFQGTELADGRGPETVSHQGVGWRPSPPATCGRGPPLPGARRRARGRGGTAAYPRRPRQAAGNREGGIGNRVRREARRRPRPRACAGSLRSPCAAAGANVRGPFAGATAGRRTPRAISGERTPPASRPRGPAACRWRRPGGFYPGADRHCDRPLLGHSESRLRVLSG